jgi:hypothetical protein
MRKMDKKLKNELKNLKKKNNQLYLLQQDVRRLAEEYQLSVFAKIRFMRIVNKAYRQAMEYGFLMEMKDEQKEKEPVIFNNANFKTAKAPDPEGWKTPNEYELKQFEMAKELKNEENSDGWYLPTNEDLDKLIKEKDEKENKNSGVSTT